jgi:arginyl-tRNA synthetase
MTSKWFAVIAALNLVFGMTSHAQVEEKSAVAEEVVVVVATTVERPERFGKPERPERPKLESPGQEVKELVTEFRTKMAEFHAEQKELVRKLRTATEEERSEIREQLKVNREEFQSMKDEYRDSVKDVTSALKDHAVKISAETRLEKKSGRERN